MPPRAREGIEVLARKIESLAALYGEEAIVAAQKIGPQFFKVIEGAGVNSGKAIRIMAQHGEPGLAWCVSRPKAMQLVLQHGESAAAALVRHPGGIAEPVIEQFGGQAVKALQAVGPQNGRRLAMMMSEGELGKMGRTAEVLGVLARYGDPACEFLYKHRVVLAGGATLGVFLANPEPFLTGARDITKIAAENGIKPLAETPGKAAQEAARSTNFTVIALACLAMVAVAAFGALNPHCRNLMRLWVSGAGGLGAFMLLRILSPFHLR